ncbi:MAG: hypothetical protein HWE18_11530 [Gammaproteobacteria bacterium]|nr:hypothetical protein [Gammaproteobacteria bacterium]
MSSFELGVFEVKGKGAQPASGASLLLPIKGSKQMSLILPVMSVEPLITPLGAWSARCKGPNQAQFDVRSADIVCDECSTHYEMEFVVVGDVQLAAIEAMNHQGWQASLEQQICPNCNNKG